MNEPSYNIIYSFIISHQLPLNFSVINLYELTHLLNFPNIPLSLEKEISLIELTFSPFHFCFSYKAREFEKRKKVVGHSDKGWRVKHVKHK